MSMSVFLRFLLSSFNVMGDRVCGSTPDGGNLSLYTTMSTQPGHPSIGRRSDYQPKACDGLRLGSKDITDHI